MDCQKLFEAYVNAVRNNFAYEEKLENDVRCNKQSLLLKEVAASGTNRIGYIVTTCSPVTKAHIELGQQAADNLGLGKVIYVIWPFHYIPGFHNLPVEEWVQKEKHIPWNLRVELLERAITDASDSRLSVLRESKEWYIRSGVNWNSDEAQSSFWTGTWYVLRLIQAQIREINPSADFVFICGSDQFNPNVIAQEHGGGTEKVWKDYSLAEQLAIHDIYAVPRGSGEGQLIHTPPTNLIQHRVIEGTLLEHSKISATKIRSGEMTDEELIDATYPSVVRAIKRKHLWGY